MLCVLYNLVGVEHPISLQFVSALSMGHAIRLSFTAGGPSFFAFVKGLWGRMGAGSERRHTQNRCGCGASNKKRRGWGLRETETFFCCGCFLQKKRLGAPITDAFSQRKG